MTTAEKYRQLESSPAINMARYIFASLKSNATNSILGNEIIEIKTGKTPSKQNKKFYEDEFLNWFKPDEIGSEKYLYEAKDKLSKFAYEKNQATIYEPDTILINAIGDVGRISILKVRASSNQQITGIKFNNKIDVNYAYFYLLANRHFFYVDLFQTTLPIVNQKKINSIPFIYPDIKEQKNIVEGLIMLDKIKTVADLKIIESINWNEDYKNACHNFYKVQFNSKNLSTELTHQLSLVKKLRQSFLQEAVQGKLVAQNPADEPASELLKKIKAEKEKLIAEKKLKKDKPLPPIQPEEIPFEIPESWVWCRLGEICNKITDGFHNTPKKLSHGKIYISATHIREEGIKWNDCLYISENDHNELYKKAYPKKGEILITNRGAGCSTPVIIDIDVEFSFQNAALIGFNRDLVLNKFIFYFILKSRDEIMKTFVNGGLQPMLSNVVLSSIPIPLPPISEQIHIVQKLDELMQTCDELEASIKESQAQNEKLLQQVLREALRK